MIEQSIQRAYVGTDMRPAPTIRIVIPPLRDGTDPKNDANLILQKEGPKALRAMVEAASPATVPISALAERFSRLPLEQQANHHAVIKAEVKAAGGKMKDFDALVSAYEKRFADQRGADDDSHTELIPLINPVDAYVPTAELFDMVRKKLRQHVVADNWQLDLMSIWIMGTYVHTVLSVYPFLLFTAPTKAAGKTTAMITVIKMCHRGYLNLSATEALLAQIIDTLEPTLGLDEIDNLLGNKPEVIGIINGSHNKSTARRGKLEPTNEGGWEFVSRSTWCPKILAGINEDGKVLPEATLSRCLIIRMRPKTVDEKTDPLDQFAEEELSPMQGYGQAWGRDIHRAIADIVADRGIASIITKGIHGRDADNFRPLLAIAYIGGQELYAKIRKAAFASIEDRKKSETPEKSRLLLRVSTPE